MPVRFLDPALRLAVLALICMAAPAQGATAAWRMTAAPEVEGDAAFPRCEKAPAESVFFEPGDELLDLTGWMQKRYAAALAKPERGSDAKKSLKQIFPVLDQWHGDWVVWNGRTHCLIASGSWNDLYAVGLLSGFDEQPLQARTTFRLKTEEREQRFTGVSNRETAGLIEEGGNEFSYEVLFGRDTAILSLNEGSWSAAGEDLKWSIRGASLDLKDGKEKLIARRVAVGEEEFELKASVRIEELDGTPFAECRWKEEAGRKVVWPWRQLDAVVKGDRRICMGGHGRDAFLNMLKFDELGRVPVTKAPAELNEWVRGPVVDLLIPIRRVADPEVAGMVEAMFYDPVSTRLIVVGKGEVPLAVSDNSYGINDPAGPFVSAGASIQGNAWDLTCCANGKAGVFLRQGEELKPMFQLEIEAHQEEMKANCLASFPVGGELKAEATCRAGEAVGIGSLKDRDGNPQPVKLLLNWKIPEVNFD